MRHVLVCECGQRVDVKLDLNDFAQDMLKRRGPPKCFGCNKLKMRESWEATEPKMEWGA